MIAAGTEPIEIVRARVAEQLDDTQQRRVALGALLLVDPLADAAAWQQHGALLAAVDRLQVEIEAAVRPADEPWHPPSLTAGPRRAARRVMNAAEETLPLVTDRSRQAVRRIMDAAADAATEAAANLAVPDPRNARNRAAQQAAADAAAAALRAATESLTDDGPPPPDAKDPDADPQ